VNVVVFLSLNYQTGELEKMYRIHKGTSAAGELANTMILQNIMSAAMLDGSGINSEFSAIVLIMSFNS